MKIVYLAAGAGGMFCGACLHDNTLAAALLKRGEDVLLVPTYTPLRTDEEDVSQRRLFFGGINVYLQQKVALFRHTPWFLDAVLDQPGLVSWLSQRSASVDATQLGDLTVSMLEGEAGKQRKELSKLVHWLATEIKPDIVHLSNAILISMAREIRREVGAAVVCGLAGEDVFLERIPEPHYSRVRELLKARAADAQAFVAMNRYYADFMTSYMDLDPERVHVIPHGLKLDGHGTRRRQTENAFTIGYFARICPDKGLHLLVDAFKILSDDPALPPLKLEVAGYLGAEFKAYLSEQEAKLTTWGLIDRYRHRGELDRAEKISFLQSLDVMSMPAVYRESKGLSVLEALANAVPVVLPAHGTFPELIEDMQGGRLFEPEDSRSLAESLKRLILDPAAAEAMGLRGQAAVRDRYHADAMAARTLELYRTLDRHNRPDAAHADHSMKVDALRETETA